MLKTSTFALAAALATATLSGCASTPAAPFDQLKTANLTAYRLQNYEPPAAVPGATPGAVGALIPGLPAEIQTWIQQGAAGLSQLIPPGLLPGGAAALPGAADTTPRFHEFRILSQTQVLDPDIKESLGKLLGDKNSFDNADARCAPNVFYAEMGLSFTSTVGQAPNDLLVSFSCNQVVSRSFAWPHPATGMTADTVKQMSSIVQKIWPQGT
ncbi:MAG TPA: hypothetical protein VHV51_19875 [Polyangiaceae bacterium]|jgi:hypothetical protein|nr:hypothetical protein [Polyangiaceae bacterium]